MNPQFLKIDEPFKSLFPRHGIIMSNIRDDMRENDFDPAHPIVVGIGPWCEHDKGVVIDGTTRVLCARQLELDVEVVEKWFDNENEAIEYAIRHQRNRRNLSDAEIASCLKILDNRMSRGGDRHSQEFKDSSKASSEAIEEQVETVEERSVRSSGKSAEQTAELLGTSRTKIEKARTIDTHADEETKEAVKNGDMSINAAYKETQRKRKEEAAALKPPAKVVPIKRPTFNATNDSIEWAKWSWNPVTGCKHGCPYCYAKDIAARFYPGEIPSERFDPTFYEDRLEAPKHTKIPAKRVDEPGINNVFVCSMADLFGEWVPQDWIDAVMDQVRANPQWNYIFLTKNPERLATIEWPDNCWVGTTIDSQERVERAMNALAMVEAQVRFISVEPMLTEITLLPEHADALDWIIIGGQSKSTGEPEKQPEWEWVWKLTEFAADYNIPVYWKPNLTVRPKRYPGGNVAKTQGHLPTTELEQDQRESGRVLESTAH